MSISPFNDLGNSSLQLNLQGLAMVTYDEENQVICVEKVMYWIPFVALYVMYRQCEEQRA